MLSLNRGVKWRDWLSKQVHLACHAKLGGPLKRLVARQQQPLQKINVNRDKQQAQALMLRWTKVTRSVSEGDVGLHLAKGERRCGLLQADWEMVGCESVVRKRRGAEVAEFTQRTELAGIAADRIGDTSTKSQKKSQPRSVSEGDVVLHS